MQPHMSGFIVLNRSGSAEALPELEAPLARVEDRLGALTDALKADDPAALETAASELHRALSSAVDTFKVAARRGGVPAPMRQRLALASAQVAAQRESLARATAALDRAIDVLMPAPVVAGYGAGGHALRATTSGAMTA
jgi:hypothetical protein